MTDTKIVWHTLNEPEGRGWPVTEMDRRYDRLPARARDLVPELVWTLSRQSSSLYSRFSTDATAIHARWSLGRDGRASGNMTALATSGLDLYGMDSESRPRWVGYASPQDTADSEAIFGNELDGLFREYRVYFPLCNELLTVEIGVPEGARFELIDPDPAPPIVYYGTSIIHGIAASRPGMSLPAILGRRLGRPVVGLGFSGNGRMEAELGELVGEIDAALYVVDCLPNMGRDLVEERTLPFAAALRAQRPTQPILFVEDRSWSNAWVVPSRQAAHDGARRAFRAAFDRISEVDRAVHFIGHEELLGSDSEATIDGSHPTDLGFERMADALEGVMKELL